MQATLEAEVQNSESLRLTKHPSEKESLLEAYEEELVRAKEITWKNLLLTLLVIALVLGVLLPKIYISNQIYYTSKSINTMYHTFTALREENSHLKRNLELIRYQVEVLDELDQ